MQKDGRPAASPDATPQDDRSPSIRNSGQVASSDRYRGDVAEIDFELTPVRGVELESHDKKRMLLRLLKLAAPSILGSVLYFLVPALTQSFVGRRLGSNALAQYSVAVTAFNVLGLSIGFGLMSALDTLASQAFGRHPLNPEIGELLQRSLLVNVALCIPLCSLLWWAEPVLIPVYGAELAVGAAAVLKYSAVYLPFTLANNAMCKVLQAQNVPRFQLYACIIGAASCAMLNHLLVVDDVAQAGLVLLLTHVIMAISLVSFCVCSSEVVVRLADWPATTLFDGGLMREYLAVGLPSLASLVAEWWAFEVLVIIAAQISVESVSLLSMCLSVTSFCFSVCLGIGVAGTVCIGNALGANEPRDAKHYVLLTLLTDQAANVIIGSTLVMQSHHIASIFTSEPGMKEAFQRVAHLVALFHVVDSTQFVFQCIFRGAGQQRQAAIVALVTLWLIGVPLSVAFSLWQHWGIPGVLSGLVVGLFCEVPLFLVFLRGWEWVEMAAIAARTATVEGGGGDSSKNRSQDEMAIEMESGEGFHRDNADDQEAIGDGDDDDRGGIEGSAVMRRMPWENETRSRKGRQYASLRSTGTAASE